MMTWNPEYTAEHAEAENKTGRVKRASSSKGHFGSSVCAKAQITTPSQEHEMV